MWINLWFTVFRGGRGNGITMAISILLYSCSNKLLLLLILLGFVPDSVFTLLKQT